MNYWEYPSIKKHLILLFFAVSIFSCTGIYWLVHRAEAVLEETMEGETERIAHFMNRKICEEEFCRLIVGRPRPPEGRGTNTTASFGLQRLLAESRRNFGVERICLFDRGGRLAFSLPAAQEGSLSDPYPTLRNPYSEVRVTPQGRRMLDTYVPIRHPHAHRGPMERIGTFKITRDVTESVATLAALNRNGILIAIAVFLGFFLFTFVMLDRVQRLILVKERALEEALETSRANYEALKNARLKLEQSEKLSTLGTIVSGIAHELNNPLTTILGYAQLIPTTPAVQEKGLKIIEEGAIRCKKIIDNLLLFARQHKSETTIVSLTEVIERTHALFEYAFRKHNIRFITDISPKGSDVRVRGDFHQLQQVLVNLFNNALQAMEAGPPGELTCRVRRSGEVVHLEVSDSGPGIPEEILRRIFDPFFTTKEVGKGTGLGLSISFGIIRSHGGQLYARNRPEGGATFVIELPAVAGEHVAPPPQEIALPELPRPGIRRVLVIDDEASILQLCRETLESRGFVVRSIESGGEAIELLRNDSFDVVLCDLRMPGIDGRQIYEFLRRHAPDCLQRVIFMSGDTLNQETAAFLESIPGRYLKKPFDLEDLLATVYEAVGETTAPPPPEGR
ncbi:MAG: hybrid sensor histidine kinase/response regulator [Deltaproteobacteria bacterium]|nr:MAG: hybrid sensor histidine kinase/response regulator [Deltaproteobacteria bacterium]